VVPLCDSGLSYLELSDFIERCWTNDYEDQVRMSFCSEFLEFIIGPIASDSFSAVSLMRGCLVGLVLVIPHGFADGEQKQRYHGYIGTGLSTDSGYRGKGISQSLYLAFVSNVLKSSGNLGFVWLDIRHAWAGSSYSTYGGDPSKVHYKRIVDFYAKAIDYQKSAAIGKLGRLERLGIRTTTLLFPPKIDLPKGLELETGSLSAARDYGDFIHEFQGDNDIKRYFSEEELARRISFSKGRVNGVALAFRGGG